MVISNPMIKSYTNSAAPPGTVKDTGFSHVTESPQKSRPTSPPSAHTNVADKLAAMGISSNVDFSPPVPKSPSVSKPSTPINDEEEYQPVAPAPGTV